MEQGGTVLVTGGNAGIGYFVAEQLAGAGASVVLGSRNPGKADAAIGVIRERVPGADVRKVRLDLADLGSVKAAADEVGVVGAVVHNAGMFGAGTRKTTADGNEVMFATNHLGHFALTHWLKLAENGRVVVTGSLMARSARLDFDDLQTERNYKTMRAYARSKLAQMVFGFELDRRLRAAGSTVRCVVTHPGGALDSLTPNRPAVATGHSAWASPAKVLLQGKDSGAWPAVRAVLDPGVEGGQLLGPRGLFSTRGKPKTESPRPHFVDPADAKKLWDASARLTGVDPLA
ncbi:NAD(P)-dependent dehydrogenase (short-subunit alcohol dehydrogenase family) [Kibdelosporangium banguiense]|uniref:NAD(P)-dependent dehydrogenase (Short-subunit alcohol dehydrogenase family) n=1 Tax=Kibdelosporangium banguiense TaxID=1365924 RepID=A0ABS4TES1_9PSEU|nr:SDR family NAD(P)-dependent oxidoreductase [Kibdelosporangium banguiense]MBP2322904.1 NAD(P)-dependent dehydrogenase (short-subunit alcohol dehydrogenase family) [Kibdelosporangium banguiense]